MVARTVAFPVASVSRAPSGTAGLWTTVAAMLDARRSRRALAEMDRHQLADIGISPGDAMTEAARPFWDLAPRRFR